MSEKLSHQLKKPMPACNDCLPHAAMNLGTFTNAGLRPSMTLVSRLVLQEQMGTWVLYRLDADGGFVGDTWHGTKQDALDQVQREFDVAESDFELPV